MTGDAVYKPYRERVEGTRQFISELVRYTSNEPQGDPEAEAEANQRTLKLNDIVLTGIRTAPGGT